MAEEKKTKKAEEQEAAASSEEVKTEAEQSSESDKKGEEEVTLSKEKFDTLVSRLQRLEAAADKSQLSRYDNLNREDVAQTVGIRKYNGKIITQMHTVENSVEKSPKTGTWQESQVLEIHFAIGGKELVPYETYVRNYELIPATVKKKTQLMEPKERESFGEFMLEVEADDGNVYSVGSNFIN